MNTITNDEYTSLAEEIQACFTERVHIAREEIMVAHHETGKVMSDFLAEHPDVNASLLVKRLEVLGAAKETTLYLSLQCYTRWPQYESMIAELGEGKNASWNKVRKLLQAPKEKAEAGLCGHECEYHPKLELPRRSIGGGKI